MMTEDVKIDTPSQYFKENKYVVIKDLIDEKLAKVLTEYLTDKTKDMLVGDEQCPRSPSIYGDKVFDTLMLDVLPSMEIATGLKLIPTYSYARFYRPGEVLKPHVDRKECEISTTITLGYSGKVWPIHISRTNEVADDVGALELEVGSALVYRGMELNHWREEYTEGEWQCQVFLHFVDANGEYKDFKYDRRENLGDEPLLGKKRRGEYDDSYWYFGNKQEEKFLWTWKENILSDGLIDLIVEEGSKELNVAKVGYGGQKLDVNKKVRDASVSPIRPKNFEWLYRMLEKEISTTNMENFKFVLDRIEHLTYIEYHGGVETQGKYEKHTDGLIHMTRKLSFSILLSDPAEYEGGDLLIHDGGGYHAVPKKKGSIVFFPSFTDHEVTPVTKGIRRSLVGWIHGPHFT